jgi:hypothetical protein
MLSVEKSVDNDAEKEIQLFANLCELTPENLLDLDMADYSKLQNRRNCNTLTLVPSISMG